MTETSHAGRRDYDALLGLGSNMGDKAGNIDAALALLCAKGDIRLVRRSSLYRSPPWGVAEQEWFVNACAAVATKLSPHELLNRCLDAEDAMGRVREVKWGPRLIDVDVLTYGDLKIDTETLKVPHPFIEERAFVVVPLFEIAPDALVRGRPVREFALGIDRTGVEKLA